MTDRETSRARSLRRRSTPAEQALWRVLRDRAIQDLKFRRQAPIGPFVVDFVCHEHRLIVELDGGIHHAPMYDRARQAERELWLQGRGFTVLRFGNADVALPQLIVTRILEMVRADTLHPAAPRPPSPSRGEGD